MNIGERFNSISHLIGAVAAVIGLTILVVGTARQGDPWKIVSFSIYGTSLLLMYLFSTLYHSLQGSAKRVFNQLDHLAIYLLIAGTYTPLTLVTLRGSWGWSIFGVVWGLALFGILWETFYKKKPRIIPMIIYFLMGWVVLIALGPLLQALPTAGFIWLLTGGLVYTTGIVFYAFGSKKRHFHGIWHLFVLAGSFCHFLTIHVFVA